MIGVGIATASISNEQIDQTNRKICGILGLTLYKVMSREPSVSYAVA